MKRALRDKILAATGIALGIYALKRWEEAYEKQARINMALEEQVKMNGNSEVNEIYQRLFKWQKEGKLNEAEITTVLRSGIVIDHVRRGIVARKGTVDRYIEWLLDQLQGQDDRFTKIRTSKRDVESMIGL